MTAQDSTPVGRGLHVSAPRPFSGEVAVLTSVDEVLARLGDGDLSRTVLVTEQASATFFGPILPQVAGVICTRGGESAHLAIVSRGLGLSCLMQAELERDLTPGTVVVVDEQGTISVA